MFLFFYIIANQPCILFFVSGAKEGHGGKLVGGKCFNVGDVRQRIENEACDRMLIVHALGGCNSTFALFSLGKVFKADKTGFFAHQLHGSAKK